MNTIRLLAGSSNNSFASAALMQFNFSVPIAESNILVQSAYLAFTGFMTAVNTNIYMNVSGMVWRNFTIIPNTEGTDMYLLYNASQQIIALNGSGFVNGPYSFNVRPMGPAIGVPSAELFLTYNYTNDTVMRTKTLHYSPFSEVSQRVAAFPYETYTYFFIPELNASMKSLYLETSSITSATAAHVLTCWIDETGRLYSQQNTGETTFSYYLHNFTRFNYGAMTGDNGAIHIAKRDSAISSVDSGEVIGTYFFQ
jgi:hypothetical protein